MEFALEGEDCVDRLEEEGIDEKLSYMKDALLLIRNELRIKKHYSDSVVPPGP